jgi:molybdate transport system ATP-binding protein
VSDGIQLRLRLRHAAFALDLDLALPGRGITALFGPSGCGKTSCLRAIAGLDRVADALVVINGETWQDDSSGRFVPVHQRSVGYVFQEPSLFAHLSVQDNLDYGYRRAGRPTGVDHVGIVEMLDIHALLHRRTEGLSGGERQRVAIARALLGQPRLLLLDEPLAALDASRKKELLPCLARLHDHLAIPAIYVSHALDEVAQLADHLVLLGSSSGVHSGPLAQMLARLELASAFANDPCVVIETVIGAHDDVDHLSRLDFDGGALFVARRSEAIGRRLRYRIHARDVSLSLEPPVASSVLNVMPARVVDMTDTETPAHVLVRLQVGDVPLLSRISRRSWNTLQLESGRAVWAQIKSAALLA